jgi:TRAP transporter TAXI family solute receptor
MGGANMAKRRITLMVAILTISLMVIGASRPDTAQAKTTFVTIGTGGVTGVYYPTGGAISRMINAKRKQYRIRASVESTGGSVFNVNAIMAGDLEFGIVQSDRQYQAWNGLAEWEAKGAQKDLRAIFSIHPESITLVASEDSGIRTLADLKGKRVNIGNPGSGQRQNSIDALTAVGIDYEKDLLAQGLKAAEAPGMLQDGRIDAFFYTVGHPSGAIKEATSGATKVRLIPVTGPGIDGLISKFPYYARATIPIKLYPQALNKEDVPSFGVKATFVTSAQVPENVVYAMVKEVFDNFDQFKKLHPAYAVLTKENMLEGLSAPLHPGAIKYYKEVGLMP